MGRLGAKRAHAVPGRQPSLQRKNLKASPAKKSGILELRLDKRIREFVAQTHSSNADAAAAHLRDQFPEYQRTPIAQFRVQLAKRLEELAAAAPTGKEEQLEEFEARHLSRRAAAGSLSPSSSSESDSEPSSSSSESGASGSSGSLGGAGATAFLSGLEDQRDGGGGGAGRAGGGMNAALLSVYNSAQSNSPGSPRGEGAEAGAGAAAPNQAAPGVADASEPPAFAPPEEVAAAAARYVAAAKAGRQRSAGGGRGKPGEGQEAGALQPGDEQQAAPPAASPAPAAPATQKVTLQTRATSAATKPRTRKAADGEDGARAVGVKRQRGGDGLGQSGSVTRPKAITYADLGGIEGVLADIRELIEYPLRHPEVYAWLGVEPPRGVLLHGPPGCGKTALANAVANECGVPFLRVSAPEIVSGMSGESEAKLRQLFLDAADAAPCIIFIDEIDAIATKRENAQREMERRIVAQMLTCMDDLSAPMAAVPGSDPGDQAAGLAGPSAAGEGPPQPQPGEQQQQQQPQQQQPAQQQRPYRHVVVIGATNRPDALDPALRRAGRFDREIAMSIPTEAARAGILRVLARRLRLTGDFDFDAIAKRTPGFVGADLQALAKEAAALAVARIFSHLERRHLAPPQPAPLLLGSGALLNGHLGTPPHSPPPAYPEAALQLQHGSGQLPSPAVVPWTAGASGPLGPAELAGLAIEMRDFEAAVEKVQPSVRREGFTTTPDVTWADVGAMNEVREELSFAITQPIQQPERFQAMGMGAPMGVLLYGPPGCGKTLVAKAVANESGANFISIKGPELLNKYVGESERAVRSLFARAAAARPCVLFFDELDALAPRRGSELSASSERVVNQLLAEMDGIGGRQGVFLVAATNRPDMIDPALLRPGRLDKLLYVSLPPREARPAILAACARGTPLAADVDLRGLGASPRTDGFSGADLAALVREAATTALKESLALGDAAAASPRVGQAHFLAALERARRSVSPADQRRYERQREELRCTRGHLEPQVDLAEGEKTKNDGNTLGGSEAMDGTSSANLGELADPKPMDE